MARARKLGHLPIAHHVAMRGWWARVFVAAAFASGCGSSLEDSESPNGTVTGAGGATATAVSVTATASTGTGSQGGGSAEQPFPNPDWPEGKPADFDLDVAKLDQAAAIAEKYQSHCLLVIRRGTLVYERYWSGNGPTTPQRSWSIAKSYSSALVGIAIARGDISSLDDSVAKYVTQWKGTPNEAITVRHVVSMTSGLKWSMFDDYFTMVLLAKDHTKHALSLPLEQQPGTKWTYDNAAVQLLEPLFRAATGGTIEEYAEKHLWSKIGSKATWAHDPSGNPTAYASVMSSCRDHARLGYLYLRHGKWQGVQVVPSAWVHDSLEPSQPMNQAYGYLWWLNGHTPYVGSLGTKHGNEPLIPFAPPDLFAAHGFGNQFIDVIPSLDMMVVRFGADPMNKLDIGKLMEDEHFKIEAAILEPVLAAVK
jgi:CubicO group peptidase (beta-lactamase class C family)